MQFGLLIIGDEILSGKRPDRHFAKLIELLSARGLSLSWSRYIGDDRAQIAAVLRDTFATSDVVFSCGGIGATPDDHTRQAAAAALGVPLTLHPEARLLISERVAVMAAQGQGSADMKAPENLQRLKMGEFPANAEILPNPYNQIPGFRVRHHWFMPGFPVMAWPMMEAVLDTHYRHLFHRRLVGERSLIVLDLAESRVAPLLEAIELDFPLIRTFSLPSVGTAEGLQRHVELGVKGELESLPAAFERLEVGVLALGGEIIARLPAGEGSGAAGAAAAT